MPETSKTVVSCAFCGQPISNRSLQKHWQRECSGLPKLEPTEKVCSHCQRIRSEADFHQHGDRKSGKSNTCRFCAKDSNERWRSTQPKKPDGRKANTRPLGWVLRPCRYCAEQFNARQMLKHIPRCQKNPNKKHTFIDYQPTSGMEQIRAQATKTDFIKRRKKANSLRHCYGITIEQYEKMLADQGGCCAICGRGPTGMNRRTDTLHVDHSHKTGKIRSLLCHYCNVALGHMDEDRGRIRAILEYLDRWDDAELDLSAH